MVGTDGNAFLKKYIVIPPTYLKDLIDVQGEEPQTIIAPSGKWPNSDIRLLLLIRKIGIHTSSITHIGNVFGSSSLPIVTCLPFYKSPYLGPEPTGQTMTTVAPKPTQSYSMLPVAVTIGLFACVPFYLPDYIFPYLSIYSYIKLII